MRVTAAQLKQIVGGRAPYAAQAAEAFTQYSDEFEINTTLRAAHFWAQWGHESKLAYVAEIWGPTAAQSRYEGRKDLGNTQPGDGKKYMGHGLGQITGRANHREFTLWLRKRIPDCPDFEANPDKLTEFPWAIISCFWYWDTRKINALADQDDILAVSIKVNGKNKSTGLPNGLEDRKALLAKAKKVFNVIPTPMAPIKKKTSKVKVYAETLLKKDEIKYIQNRLLEMGYHEVGIVDGIWGKKLETAIQLLQTRAWELGEKVTIDGHYGPQTKNLIDPIHGDHYKRVISDTRATTTAKQLAAKGNPGVVKGRNIKFASILGIISSVAAAAYAAYEAPTELPAGSSILLAFMPPSWAAVIGAIGPYVITFGVSLYTTYKGQGVVDSSVERFREGIDNSGLPPQFDHNLGGFFSRILK